jgi:hypothetical protein
MGRPLNHGGHGGHGEKQNPYLILHFAVPAVLAVVDIS